LLERLRYVRGIGIHPVVGGAIPEFRFAQFVREGGVAPAFLLSDYSVNRRRATLTAAVIDLEARLADAAIQMFDRLIGGMFTRARRGRERRYQDSIQSVGQLMRLFGATITALDEAVQNGGDPLELIDEAVGWHRLVAAKAQVDALADLAGEDALVTATERYATLRRFSPAFLDAFTFKASGTGTALIKAIDVIRDANTRKSRDLPDGVPLPFPNRQWKRLITESGRIDRRRYEIAIMATLRDRLRAVMYGSREPATISASMPICWVGATPPKWRMCFRSIQMLHPTSLTGHEILTGGCAVCQAVENKQA
jgi:hypothetical protein